VRVDYERRTVRWEGREVWVRAYPISINAPAFEELARRVDTRRELRARGEERPHGRLLVELRSQHGHARGPMLSS